MQLQMHHARGDEEPTATRSGPTEPPRQLHRASDPTKGTVTTFTTPAWRRLLGALAVLMAGLLLAIAPSLPAHAASAPSTLTAPAALQPGQSLGSPNGEFILVMQSDGNLVEYRGATALWSSGTYGHPGAYLAVQTDGNIVVYSASGNALWASGSGGHPSAAYVLSLQSDANLVIYTPGGSAIWANYAVAPSTLTAPLALAPGQYLESPNRLIILAMQTDGNLVEYAGATALWSSGSYGHPGAYLAVQTDGNIVVYSPSGVPLWTSGTGGRPNAAYVLAIQSDANLVIYGPTGAIWANGAQAPVARAWGQGRSSNLFPWGQCTWEAEQDFANYIAGHLGGHQPYPNIWGNADQWAASAQARGWTVTSTPQVNSVVVMQPGVDGASSVGHVAWVEQVSGSRIYVDQMNVPEGNPHPSQQWYQLQPSMQFILAP